MHFILRKNFFLNFILQANDSLSQNTKTDKVDIGKIRITILQSNDHKNVVVKQLAVCMRNGNVSMERVDTVELHTNLSNLVQYSCLLFRFHNVNDVEGSF